MSLRLAWAFAGWPLRLPLGGISWTEFVPVWRDKTPVTCLFYPELLVCTRFLHSVVGASSSSSNSLDPR